MASGGRRRGALEREVLSCLSVAGRPATVADVLAQLGGELAYTTVLTTLARLHSKGAVVREQAGRAFAYSMPSDPVAADASVTARRMSRLLQSREDRAGVLARFVADLSAEDERLLADLLGQGQRPEEEQER